MKNTFLNMLRPGGLGEETENQETVSTNLADERPAFKATTEEYQTPEYDFLNSEIWTNESSANIKIAEPRTFEDAEIITEAIRVGKIVIMYLDEVDETETAQRILDFISGYCHSLHIKPEKMKAEAQWLINPQQ